ncbi:muscarinic acetylcholine receptor M1-like [Scyliorhinus canicula]|uniref:muscarinic acetylcholine receptor M1-like n=1 Tax=Scyliorhinus canicula TaxID=7830 RepID=UPI0018F605BC|nr:muscarinic acetylcholine receptor M1-like [Scyliorhinus canicula]
MTLPAVTLLPTVSLGNSSYDPLGGHRVWEVVLLTLVSASLSLVTITGNILVVLSFKFNRQLKTVNNYFLLSLAYADLIIGALSMNLYTTYIVMDRWALGSVACDLWLTLDYVASNASVMNLLVISFDRYFSITRPLTYRAKRTPRKAVIIIVLAWSISFILWAPAILLYQHVLGQRTLKPGSCSIQFLSMPAITVCTAIAAFYLPVTIMAVLYWRIYSETTQRTKELAALQGREDSYSGNSTGSHRGNDSCPRSQDAGGAQRLCREDGESSALTRNHLSLLKVDREKDDSSCASSESMRPEPAAPPSDGPPGSEGTPLWPCCLHTQPVLIKPGGQIIHPASTVDAAVSVSMTLLRSSQSGQEVELEESSFTCQELMARPGNGSSPKGLKKLFCSSLLSKAAPLAGSFNPKSRVVPRRRTIIKEKKAAKTLSAILLAFFVTWCPYNIMVLVSAFCEGCIPRGLWHLGYWLCYLNSTVNPMCYALCNREFRVTFKMLLLCFWDKRKWALRQAMRKTTPT